MTDAPATTGTGFVYWYVTRACNEDQKWEIDRILKLLPEEEVQERFMATVTLGGGEIG